MPSYVIFQGDVTDPVRYEEYKKAAGPNINGGRNIPGAWRCCRCT